MTTTAITPNSSDAMWEHLPHECWLNICLNFCPDDTPLVQLSKVSTFFRDFMLEFLAPSYEARYSLTPVGTFKHKGHVIVSQYQRIHILSKEHTSYKSFGEENVEGYKILYIRHDKPEAIQSGFFCFNLLAHTGLILLQSGVGALLETTKTPILYKRKAIPFTNFPKAKQKSETILTYDSDSDRLACSVNRNIYVSHNRSFIGIASYPQSACTAIHLTRKLGQSTIFCAFEDCIVMFVENKPGSQSYPWSIIGYLKLPPDVSKITCLHKGKNLYAGCENGEVFTIFGIPNVIFGKNQSPVDMKLGNKLRWSASTVTSLRKIKNLLYVRYENTIGIASINGNVLKFDGRVDTNDSFTALESMKKTGEIICTTTTGFCRIDKNAITD